MPLLAARPPPWVPHTQLWSKALPLRVLPAASHFSAPVPALTWPSAICPPAPESEELGAVLFLSPDLSTPSAASVETRRVELPGEALTFALGASYVPLGRLCRCRESLTGPLRPRWGQAFPRPPRAEVPPPSGHGSRSPPGDRGQDACVSGPQYIQGHPGGQPIHFFTGSVV